MREKCALSAKMTTISDAKVVESESYFLLDYKRIVHAQYFFSFNKKGKKKCI